MNKAIKNELSNVYRNPLFDSVEDSQEYMAQVVDEYFPEGTEEQKIDATMDAEDFVKDMRVKFDSDIKQDIDAVDGFEDVPKGVKKYFKENVISNLSNYGDDGKFNAEEMMKTLGGKKAKTLSKLYQRIKDVRAIRGQKDLYEERDMSVGEGVGRALVPNAYDREGALSKTFSGAVDLMEAPGRLATAAWRSAKDEVPFGASLTAPRELRTDEEQIAQGLLSSTTPVTALPKLVGKGAVKLATKYGADKMARLGDKLSKSKVGKVYNEGAKLIDKPKGVPAIEAAETAVTSGTKTGDFGRKLTTNLMRQLPKEATVTGAYVGDVATDENKSKEDVVYEALGGLGGTLIPTLFKSFGTGIGRYTKELKGDIDATKGAMGIDKDYASEIIAKMDSKGTPITNETVVKFIENDLTPKINALAKSDGELIEKILISASDNPKGITPTKLIARAKSDFNESLKDRGDLLASDKEALKAETFANLDEIALTMKENMSRIKPSEKLSKAKSNLGVKKGQYTDELEAQQARKLEEGNTISNKEYDSEEDFLVREGTEEDLAMNERLIEMGGDFDKPALLSAQKARIPLSSAVREEGRMVSTRDMGATKGMKTSASKYPAKEAAKSLEKQIVGGIEDKAERELYGKSKGLYKSLKNLGFDRIEENGRINRAEVAKVIKGIANERSKLGEVNNITEKFKQFDKEASDIQAFFKKNGVNDSEVRKYKAELDKTAKDIESLNISLKKATDLATHRKILEDLYKKTSESKNSRSVIEGIVLKTVGAMNPKNILGMTGPIKKIATSAGREAPKSEYSNVREKNEEIDYDSLVDNSAYVKQFNKLAKMKTPKYDIPVKDMSLMEKESLTKMLKSKFKKDFNTTLDGDTLRVIRKKR